MDEEIRIGPLDEHFGGGATNENAARSSWRHPMEEVTA